MIQLTQIRNYFKPIQPSVKAGKGNISYKEFAPHPDLENLIHCYWQLKTQESLELPFQYRVVSDGCVDIFFNVKAAEESFVMGFSDKFKEFAIGTDFDFAGIRFYPSIFTLFFGISAKSLKNQDQALKPLLPKMAEFISQHLKRDFAAFIPQLDTYFQALIQQNSPEIDQRFYRAFLEILKRKGNLEVETELDTGLSPRQLRRLFNHYIGTTPKSFSQVIRFQYILNETSSLQDLKEDKIFYELGFFDQAHFIKNFRKFYGVTPSKAFD